MFSVQPFFHILQGIIFSSLLLAHQPATAGDHPVPFSSPVVDILIDVGHGGIDGGTSYDNVLEKDINLQIAKNLFLSLQEKHYSVAINRTSDYALSDDNRMKLRSRHQRDLSQRKEIANALQPKVMVSLHVNWSRRESNSGAIVIYQKNEDSKQLAKAIQQSLNHYYQNSNPMALGRKYFLLNQANCPAVIIEMGFISNEGDRHKLTDPQEQRKIALAISDGIAAFFHQVYTKH